MRRLQPPLLNKQFIQVIKNLQYLPLVKPCGVIGPAPPEQKYRGFAISLGIVEKFNSEHPACMKEIYLDYKST